MALNSMDQCGDVGIPYTYFVVEASRKQQNHGLVERKSQDSSGVLTVDPLLFVVYCVPQDQLAIHPA